ncbi:acyl carrier protein [Sporosarcina sp. 6E9]|uniref:acyl carrier protein n=1 Tax=Sporosarcina sp. 6E9 TaxID=2819235 RepID=UPI001B316827|nr:phosphopantetheine-binding protein [Sporosarcina sp. 6E9]
MNKEKMIELIISAIKEVVNVDHAIQKDTKLFDDLSLDSTSIIELLMVLEDVVPNLIIDPEELKADHFKTVETLSEYALSSLGEEVQ